MPTVTGRAMQVPAAGGAFELVKKEFPEPGPGQVRIKVQACGVCHSDSLTKLGHWPGIKFPRVPGHEVAGVLDAVAAGCAVFKVGQRVGLGWHGGHCNYCDPCRRGDFILCENQLISGIDFDGGYADYVIAPANALALIPEHLAMWMRRRCSARALRRITRCGTAERGRAIRWRFWGLAGWGTWRCSTRPRADTAPSRLRAGRTRLRWPSNWARMSTSTARRRIRPRS